eukprot:CAMPEP_0184693756 /NCGR_PEP_ID=MMETSP0313-20130426/1913_1 /TAXON_ID=2792 /ORGANISM="Porphyridium aerugineum, Strain SAG 1380-2" /LENGTH=250 /DNA_ID=CAMNT_0027151919 /DNA_START=12 /DNA_END=764 /DNA_ORIENTATION=+
MSRYGPGARVSVKPTLIKKDSHGKVTLPPRAVEEALRTKVAETIAKALMVDNDQAAADISKQNSNNSEVKKQTSTTSATDGENADTANNDNHEADGSSSIVQVPPPRAPVSESEAMQVAKKIEVAMYSKYNGCNTEYKDKARTLSFNIKDKLNAGLREAILDGSVLPAQLVDMTSDDLANEREKSKRAKINQEMIREAQPFNNMTASTDQFRCGKCRQRKCTYYQLQTRSADEPMTTFVTCVNCGNRWRC